MPISFEPPAHWGEYIPTHWRHDYTLYGWMMTEHEFRGASLSQCGQDLIAEYICIEDEKSLLDIGANDGITGSSTLYLENQNWKGVLVEPNLSLVSNLQKARKSPVLAVGVGENSGIYTLFTSHVHTLGTLVNSKNSYEYQRLCRESGGEEKLCKQLVTVLSVDDIFKICKSHLSSHPSFVKLDVEGFEQVVINGILNTDAKPTLIEVENNTRTDAWADALNKNGYSLLMVLDSFVEIWIKSKDIQSKSSKVRNWL